MEEQLRHVWDGNTVRINCRKRHLTRDFDRSVVIDFDKIDVARGGLLEVSISSAPAPYPVQYAGKLRRVLLEASKNETLKQILGTSVGLLYPWQIDMLLAGFEDVIERWGLRSSDSHSYSARDIFKHCNEALADGTLPKNCGFKSRFPDARSTAALPLAESFYDVFDTRMLSEPLSATDFESLDELQSKAKSHLQVRLDKVLSICESIVDEYVDLRKTLNNVAASPPPPQVTTRMLRLLAHSQPAPDTFEALDESSRLWIALRLSDRDFFQKSYPTTYLKLRGISCLEKLTFYSYGSQIFEVLLSRTYIPRYVLLACLIIVQAGLIWNLETTLSLTSQRIKLRRNRIEVYGTKYRVKKKQDAEVSNPSGEETRPETMEWNEVSDLRTAKVLKLLLEHDSAIALHAKRDSQSVFCALDLKSVRPYRFAIPNYPHLLIRFIEKIELPKFISDDLRGHAATIEYLERGKDIHALSSIMGHENLSTTEGYLNYTLIRLLNEANIKRYMDILAPTIVFCCRGRSAVRSLKLEESRIDENLLFPISSMSEENQDCLSDQWIASNGNLKLKIGANEIQHCALQMLFYRTNLRRLISDNENRFRIFHLPRLIFCVALYSYIKSSKYGFVLNQCEEMLNAP